MENEFLMQLVQKLNTDSNFLNEFLKKETLDEMYEFASNSISGYTKEEFAQMLRLLKKCDDKNAELSDDSLDNVVGGSIIGILAAGGVGFLGGGGQSLIKKLSDKLNKKDNDKKYNDYKKKNNLNDDDIVEMLVKEKSDQNSKTYKQGLIDEFKKSL